MTLQNIRKITNILKFGKNCFTKGGFRLAQQYVSGLISLNKKSVRKIAKTGREKRSAVNRILNGAKFEKKKLQERYIKKIKYLFKNTPVYLIFDDTLVERNGKKIEEAQKHFDHNEGKYVKGHQFFTSMLYTPFLQLPLFPELYSKNSDSKIEMAKHLIDKVYNSKIKIDTVLFDSWYSDEKLIKNCLSKNLGVVAAIKSNRVILPDWKNRKISLSFISERIHSQKLEKYFINNKNYQVWSTKARLNKLPWFKLLISEQRNEKGEFIGKNHLVSSRVEDNPEEIIKTYSIRWCIETYHRDIKQNLGFAKVFFRRREGIVRHSILAVIAYAAICLFMYRSGINKTIGECCDFLSEEANKESVKRLVEINNKPKRMKMFNEMFI